MLKSCRLTSGVDLKEMYLNRIQNDRHSFQRWDSKSVWIGVALRGDSWSAKTHRQNIFVVEPTNISQLLYNMKKDFTCDLLELSS